MCRHQSFHVCNPAAANGLVGNDQPALGSEVPSRGEDYLARGAKPRQRLATRIAHWRGFDAGAMSHGSLRQEFGIANRSPPLDGQSAETGPYR